MPNHKLSTDYANTATTVVAEKEATHVVSTKWQPLTVLGVEEVNYSRILRIIDVADDASSRWLRISQALGDDTLTDDNVSAVFTEAGVYPSEDDGTTESDSSLYEAEEFQLCDWVGRQAQPRLSQHEIDRALKAQTIQEIEDLGFNPLVQSPRGQQLLGPVNNGYAISKLFDKLGQSCNGAQNGLNKICGAEACQDLLRWYSYGNALGEFGKDQLDYSIQDFITKPPCLWYTIFAELKAEDNFLITSSPFFMIVMGLCRSQMLYGTSVVGEVLRDIPRPYNRCDPHGTDPVRVAILGLIPTITCSTTIGQVMFSVFVGLKREEDVDGDGNTVVPSDIVQTWPPTAEAVLNLKGGRNRDVVDAYERSRRGVTSCNPCYNTPLLAVAPVCASWSQRNNCVEAPHPSLASRDDKNFPVSRPTLSLAKLRIAKVDYAVRGVAADAALHWVEDSSQLTCGEYTTRSVTFLEAMVGTAVYNEIASCSTGPDGDHAEAGTGLPLVFANNKSLLDIMSRAAQIFVPGIPGAFTLQCAVEKVHAADGSDIVPPEPESNCFSNSQFSRLLTSQFETLVSLSPANRIGLYNQLLHSTPGRITAAVNVVMKNGITTIGNRKKKASVLTVLSDFDVDDHAHEDNAVNVSRSYTLQSVGTSGNPHARIDLSADYNIYDLEYTYSVLPRILDRVIVGDCATGYTAEELQALIAECLVPPAKFEGLLSKCNHYQPQVNVIVSL